MQGNDRILQTQPKITPARVASWKITLAFCLAGILSRWSLRGRLLYDPESASLAFAAAHLDRGGVPASTGALFIALGRQLMPLLGSPEVAFAAMSAAASGLAITALYLLGVALFGEIAGILAAALLMTSPLFWFYGAVGLPYACDALIAIVAAWLCWPVARGYGRYLFPLALWLALAGGLRPGTALALLPLAFFAAWQAFHVESLRPAQLVGSILAGGALSMAWLLPPAPHLGELFGFEHGSSITLGLANPLGNLARLGQAISWGWALAALPALGTLSLWALGVPGFLGRDGRWGWLHDERIQFLGIWAAPWLLFAMLIGIEAPGQIAICLPILMLWSAATLVRFITVGVRRLAIVATALIILGNAALFLVVPERPSFASGQRLLSAATIANHDRRLAAAITAIRGFSSTETVILAVEWQPLGYYLPKYKLIAYDHAPDDQMSSPVGLTAEQRAAARLAAALIWFEPALDRYNTAPSETEFQPMAAGTLRVLRPQRAEELVVGDDSFGLRIKRR